MWLLGSNLIADVDYFPPTPHRLPTDSPPTPHPTPTPTPKNYLLFLRLKKKKNRNRANTGRTLAINMGGRRKSKRKAPTRKVAAPLDQVFTCPICHEEKAVRCTLYVSRVRLFFNCCIADHLIPNRRAYTNRDSKAKQGTVACTKCNRSHSYRITGSLPFPFVAS